MCQRVQKIDGLVECKWPLKIFGHRDAQRPGGSDGDVCVARKIKKSCSP